MLDNIEHIFWDLDHTLWDFDSNSIETLNELYETFNLAERSRGQAAPFFVERYLFHNDRMWKMYRENRISKGRLRKARFELALRDIRIEDKALAKRMGEEYMSICPRKTKLNPNAKKALETLAPRFHMHILSNGFHETQLTKLEHSGILHYFDHIITSEKAGAKKPDPKMYSYAEKVTGARKKNSVIVGDNELIDVKGGIDSGWSCIHFKGNGTSEFDPAVSDLLGVIDLLS